MDDGYNDRDGYERVMSLGAPQAQDSSGFTRGDKLVLTHELRPDNLSRGMRGLITAIRDLRGTTTGDQLAAAFPELDNAVERLNDGTFRRLAERRDFLFAEVLPHG